MYLDSAVIVKLLVHEEDSAWFNSNIVGHELWTSELALAEVRSAILIKERAGLVTANERKAAFALFESMHEGKLLRLHPLNAHVVERAAGLLESCHPDVPLRSLDAIHLATALIHGRGPLCTNDGKLRSAARRLGVACFPEDLAIVVRN
jgi:predicted nucleic acid-binding protein